MVSYVRNRQKKIRQRVLDRDGYICCYCNQTLIDNLVTLDHIIPDSQDGTFNATNLTIACGPCNFKRADAPFFEYIKQFNFSKEKIKKYKRLCSFNLKIKVLNIAKDYLINYYEIPQNAIDKACNVLDIPFALYDEFLSELSIQSFKEFQKRTDIIFAFEQLIHLIEDMSF